MFITEKCKGTSLKKPSGVNSLVPEGVVASLTVSNLALASQNCAVLKAFAPSFPNKQEFYIIEPNTTSIHTVDLKSAIPGSLIIAHIAHDDNKPTITSDAMGSCYSIRPINRGLHEQVFTPSPGSEFAPCWWSDKPSMKARFAVLKYVLPSTIELKYIFTSTGQVNQFFLKDLKELPINNSPLTLDNLDNYSEADVLKLAAWHKENRLINLYSACKGNILYCRAITALKEAVEPHTATSTTDRLVNTYVNKSLEEYLIMNSFWESLMTLKPELTQILLDAAQAQCVKPIQEAASTKLLCS